MVAGIFKLFGIYTLASALVMLTLNNLFSLPDVSCRSFSFPAGSSAYGSGLGWLDMGFFPLRAMTLANATVWETTMTTLLFSLVDAGNATPGTFDEP